MSKHESDVDIEEFIKQNICSKDIKSVESSQNCLFCYCFNIEAVKTKLILNSASLHPLVSFRSLVPQQHLSHLQRWRSRSEVRHPARHPPQETAQQKENRARLQLHLSAGCWSSVLSSENRRLQVYASSWIKQTKQANTFKRKKNHTIILLSLNYASHDHMMTSHWSPSESWSQHPSEVMRVC